MIPIDPQLRHYIESEIFPRYRRNEAGHGIKHIKYVIRRSFHFAAGVSNINPDIVYTVAAYHDLGHCIDPQRHEIISAQIATADPMLPQFFSQKERQIIEQAIEDHRASSDHAPRNIYGRIVSTADRGTSVAECLLRSYSYGKHIEPQASDEELFERAFQHLQAKFGACGYAKSYFEDEEYRQFLRDMRALLADKDAYLRAQKNLHHHKN